ncbi:hypothetical protein Bca52824_025599 [Brassica carinata]|uniref:Uncharacterized protein n=1 Tax=Brassica carinata TaxID=52824 RepID=A0A8X7V9G3_BRACI|nr:hypothetical protein Bca52824_025599 [Brassica carinata]
MRQKVPDNHLPLRLFATALYPCGRLNIYSKLDLLAFIHYALRDTEEFETIKASCFGKFLFVVFEIKQSVRNVNAKMYT